MAYNVSPECRYNHGQMIKMAPIPRLSSQATQPASYFICSVYGEQVDMGSGFTLEIWKCRVCSYIELHDTSDGEK
jgi:hypothetical protein